MTLTEWYVDHVPRNKKYVENTEIHNDPSNFSRLYIPWLSSSGKYSNRVWSSVTFLAAY